MMHDWPIVSLGELLRLERRPVEILPDKQYAEIGTYSFGRGIFHKEPRSGLEVGDKDLFLIKEGDFILQITFAWEGAVGLASAAEDGMYGSVRFPTFRIDESRCFPKFLVNYFRTPSGLQQLGRISPGSAGRNRVLSIKQVPEVFVPLPPLNEQRRLVARIEALAAKIEEARGLRRLAVEEAKALLVSSRSKIFEKDLIDFPVVRLDNIADIQLGKMLSPKSKTGKNPRPYLRNANVQWDRLDLSQVFEMDFDEREVEKFTLHAGDLLVCEGGIIGRAAVWNNEIEGCLYQKALHRVRIQQDKTIPRFILNSLFWGSDAGKFTDLQTQTTIAHLPAIKLKSFQIHCPPLEEQRRIVAYLDGLQSKVDALKALQLQTQVELDALLPSVLDKAFKGEL